MAETANMELSRFDYSLDPSLIASAPLARRDQSRLLVYHSKRQVIEHRQFKSLPEYLQASDLLVFNDTRVFPARLRGTKKTGGKIELLLLRPISGPNRRGSRLEHPWEVLVKGRCNPPLDLRFEGEGHGIITRNLEDGRKEIVVDFPGDRYPDIFAFLAAWGEVPLPPYIVKRRSGERRIESSDPLRYQTIYAKKWGSAAAPTAGLHFTNALIDEIKAKGIQTSATTLHIGIDTFQPIRSESILEHKMHREWFQVPPEAAAAINETKKRGGRVVSVGTTVTRALESASQADGSTCAEARNTDLFITPGYRFKAVDALITNFHLPRSTLMVLVAAFAGEKVVQSIYREAMHRRYRFYSYGDAMLII